MKFSLVDGIKQEPAPKLKGICCHCGSATQSKCGTRKVWHWAHINLQHCDSWWENETDWHRFWKSYFPSQNQEVVHFDEMTGEKHIADIKTNDGIVIEIQNSPMNESELLSREGFYGNMIWIVNGEKFKQNFTILGKLPYPASEIAQKVRFHQPTLRLVRARKNYKLLLPDDECGRLRASNPVMFHFKNDNLHYEKALQSGLDCSWMLVAAPSEKIHCQVLKEIEVEHTDHYTFVWGNPRSVWFQAKKSVFIDFGGSDLWQLISYDSERLQCVKRVSKAELVARNGGCYFDS